jgi:hypothetical protein
MIRSLKAVFANTAYSKEVISMIDTTLFLALMQSIEQAHETTLPLERWLSRAKELQRELSWRVVALSRYIEVLPESSYASYADALASALRDPELEPKKEDVCDLENKVREFANLLEERGHGDKAAPLREAIDRECRLRE